MQPDKKINKAKIGLLLDEPFFGVLLCNLNLQRDDKIPTMATNSVDLRWSPKFVEAESKEALQTVLAHEVLHCALLHCLRRGNRDPKKWNMAADYAVNQVLEECNELARKASKPLPFTWPKTVQPLLSPVYAGKSAEEIYGALPDPPPQPQGGNPGKPGQGQGQDPSDGNGMGECEDAPGAQDEAAAHEQETRWKVAIDQAQQSAKGRGQLPGSLARMVEELLNPKQTWEEILRRFVKDNAKNDYCWTRPNPRYLNTGFILPSLHSEQLGRIVVAVDNSGSIDQDALNRFFGELEGILSEARPASVLLIVCDDGIQSIAELAPDDSFPREFPGGGGTSFKPVFEYVQEHGETPAALIYLTDLDGDFPEVQPDYPVLWGVYNSDRQAPFGETIRIDQ